MDLEQYKTAWKNQPKETNLVSQADIYKMAHKKSSSIVKWIFIIGVIEFLALGLFTLLYDSPEDLEFENSITGRITMVLNYLYYPIIFYFLYHFYKNYKSISIMENTKKLMTDILKTRKVVKQYIIVNISVVILIVLMVFTEQIINKYETFEMGVLLFILIIEVVFTIIFAGIVFLIYQLLYGILLKKLTKNYKELSKLDE